MVAGRGLSRSWDVAVMFLCVERLCSMRFNSFSFTRVSASAICISCLPSFCLVVLAQVLGTPVQAIMATEDRDVFNQKLMGE